MSCWSERSSRAFYARDERGIPPGGVARMRKSMAYLTPIFSANRAVREYTEKHYLPAAAAYGARAANGGQLGSRAAPVAERIGEALVKGAIRFSHHRAAQ